MRSRRKPFNYNIVSPYVQREAEHAALCIASASSEIKTRALEIGGHLVAIKKLMSHGTFIDWVDQVCGLRERTAENYMRAFEFAQLCPIVKTSDAFSLRTIYLVAPMITSADDCAVLDAVIHAKTSVTSKELVTALRLQLNRPVARKARRAAANDGAHPARIAAPALADADRALIEDTARRLTGVLADVLNLVRRIGVARFLGALSEYEH